MERADNLDSTKPKKEKEPKPIQLNNKIEEPLDSSLENIEALVNRLKQLSPEERAQFTIFYDQASADSDWNSSNVAREAREWARKLQSVSYAPATANEDNGAATANEDNQLSTSRTEPSLDVSPRLNRQTIIDDEDKSFNLADESTNLTVMSHAVYQSLREALALNNFQPTEDNPWPTAVLKKRGGATGQAQLKPAIMDGNAALISSEEVDRLAQLMWRQQKELSDLDADALDLLSHIWLQQARTPNDKAVADVDQFLALRGLEQKHRSGAVRSGYDSEQRATMLKVLSHIQNIWLHIGDVEVYVNNSNSEEVEGQNDNSEQEPLDNGRKNKARSNGETRRGRTIKKAIQSRAFVITDRIGQMKLDGNLDVERFIFQPGHLFSQFLFGPGRQTALLSAKAVQYDPYRQKWEKRLARYLSWQWRIKARSGDYARPYKVNTLLEAVGEELNLRRPAVTRERLEKALDTLQADGVIAAWHYQRWDEQTAAHKGWGQEWLNATALIDPPEIIREKYNSIERSRDKLGGPLRLNGANSSINHHGLDTELSSPLDADAYDVGDPAAIEQLTERFRLKRLSLSVSQAVAARQLGVTQGYLSQLERQQTRPTLDLIKRMQRWIEGGR